jgi:Galactose oxidase, central domain
MFRKEGPMRFHWRTRRSTLAFVSLVLSLVPWLAMPSALWAGGPWNEGPRMPSRAGHVAVYDTERERVVIFGGYDAYDEFKSDTWAVSTTPSSSWERIAESGPVPPGRYFHSGIYDPVRERLIVFGGYDGDNRNDVWALSLSGDAVWTQLTPGGTPPAARWGHAAVYDAASDRMIVIGGAGAPGNMNDVWALSLGATPQWTQLTPSGAPPSPRRQHACAYDAAADRVVVIGGNDGSLRNDVWALALSGAPSWSALSPTGTGPSARRGHSTVYDPADDRVLVFGGYDGSYRVDVFALALSGGGAWTALSPPGPFPNAGYAVAAILDEGGDRLLVCGGDNGPARVGDVWALVLNGSPTWSELTPDWPEARWGHAVAYDSQRDQMLLVGGSGSSGFETNDVWSLSLDAAPVWSLLATQGTPPSGRRQHSVIYDSRRDRLIVFAGINGALRNDTWALSLRAPRQWVLLTPGGSAPTPRRGHIAVYDAARDRMLVFGGYDGNYLSDVWALNLTGTATWTKLAPSVAQPSPRYAACAILDPVRDRLVIFGGDTGASRVNDAWALSLGFGSSWTRITAATSPGVRAGHSGIYDSQRDRLVIFGGYNAYNTFMADAWALSLAGSPAWTDLAPGGDAPPGRYFHSAVYDPEADRMAILGGYSGGISRDDLWFLGFESPSPLADQGAPVEPAASAAQADPLALRIVGRNPVRAEEGIALELAIPAPGTVASLRVFDASGRHVATLHEGWMQAGVSRRLVADEVRSLAAGVYFLRLQAGEESTTARVVLLR